MPPKALRPGKVLPNGSTIVASHTDGDSTVILAVLEDNKHTPWVTWLCHTDNPESTHWGHYFGDLNKAAADFDIRVGKG